MKLFSDCSGPCILCACSGGCLAGHGDDDFCPASSDTLFKRLKTTSSDDNKITILGELKKRGEVALLTESDVFIISQKVKGGI